MFHSSIFISADYTSVRTNPQMANQQQCTKLQYAGAVNNHMAGNPDDEKVQVGNPPKQDKEYGQNSEMQARKH